MKSDVSNGAKRRSRSEISREIQRKRIADGSHNSIQDTVCPKCNEIINGNTGVTERHINLCDGASTFDRFPYNPDRTNVIVEGRAIRFDADISTAKFRGLSEVIVDKPKLPAYYKKWVIKNNVEVIVNPDHPIFKKKL